MVTSIVLATVALTPLRVQAVAYLYHFGTVFSGSAPAAPAPWVDALYQDVTPGTVRLTLSNVGLTGSENVFGTYLNLDPSLNPTSLTFANVGGSGGFDLPTISTGVDAYKADGDGYFDIKLVFNNDGLSDASRFTAGEYVIYDISGISGLSAANFAFLSAPDGAPGVFYGAAHIQRVPGDASGWVGSPVPEPSAQFLFLLAASLWFGLRLSRRGASAGRV